MQKVRTEGRLPFSIDKDLGLALNTIIREHAAAINELIDNVMPKAVPSAVVTADALIRTGKAIYRGFTVSVVTATGTIDIRNGLTAGSGTIVDTIPIGTAVGAGEERMMGVICDTGIFADFNGGATGSITVFYEPVQ